MNKVDSLYTDIAETCNQRDKTVRVSAWENGRDLYIVREALKAQKLWVEWCDKHLDFTRATATNYINLYLAYPECKTILQDGITLSMAYKASKAPDPEKEIQFKQVVEKAHSGEKLNDDDLSIGMDKHGVDEPAKRAAIRVVNEVSPQLARDMVITGAITNLDGDDIPIAEADETLFRVQAENERKERIMRHVETELIPLEYKAHTIKDGILTVSFVAPVEAWHIVGYKAIVSTPQAERKEGVA